MSNSFEEKEIQEIEEIVEPISAEKLVERFIGNIAESDDDYDDEEQSFDGPKRKPSAKILNNIVKGTQKVVQQSFFSKSPIINSSKRLFED